MSSHVPNAKIFAKKYLSRQICLREVGGELEAQIRKVKNQGVNISHLDSHQHVHMLPKILAITVELAKKYCIPAIRIPNEPVRSYMLPITGKSSRVLELMALKFFCHLARNLNILRPDHFVGFFFGGNLNTSNLLTVLRDLPQAGTCELMCHPGFEDPGTRYGHWDYHWSDELKALTAQDISDFLRHQDIRLISYRHLESARK